MKAQDKVYIDDFAVVNDCTTKISIKPLPNFSEYIRKDALLEWAKETYLNENASAIRKVCYKQLIDKLKLM